jgi:hypothetical protein
VTGSFGSACCRSPAPQFQAGHADCIGQHSATSRRSHAASLRSSSVGGGEVALGYFSAVRRMIRQLYAIGLVWTNRRFPIGPGPPRKDMYRARRRCTRRARSMRLPRTRKPPDEHCAVGRVRSQRHQSAARDRTIVFSDAPHGPSFLRTIPTIQTWKRGAVGAENVAPFSRAACDIPVA